MSHTRGSSVERSGAGGDAFELSEFDVHLLREGTHGRLAGKLGCHLTGESGAHFAVWAPNAAEVSVIGEWNGWRPGVSPLAPRGDGSGVWHGHVPDVRHGHRYKYRIRSHVGAYVGDKADPLAFHAEAPPETASRAWDLSYHWNDAHWMGARIARNAPDAPIAIYEIHAGSFRRREDGGLLGYRELGEALADHVAELGFTHVELMPLTEHPFYGSWGYQTTGYYAPTARYGTPQDLMAMVDLLHQRGIGVLLDWVPSHFPTDAHGLQFFDGTHLYEHADPRLGRNPEWNSSVFDYGRGEVRSFLLSSAMFWLDAYHLDGLRVDAVASMLYLDYARPAGQWVANRHGGRENLEAIHFLKELNRAVHREHPDVVTVAEESTAWPRVSRPIEAGGLGFGMKWNMGWMHDTLAYLRHDPIERAQHHGELTFSMVYAYNENYVLPLSHDEVAPGKGSLFERMPGDDWRRLATLRALYGYMWSHPGKKLLFMGAEFAQRREWNHDGELDWWQRVEPEHAGVQRYLQALNRLYREQPALWQLDFDTDGFEWIEADDAAHSVIAFLRKPRSAGAWLLVVCNFTPVPRENYPVGVPLAGTWHEVLNSDARDYGGAGWGNLGAVEAAPVRAHGRHQSLSLVLPPLATIILAHDGGRAAAAEPPR